MKELRCAANKEDILQQILVKKGKNPYVLGQEVDNSYAFFTIKLDEVTARLPKRLPNIPVNCSVQMLVADTATNTIYQTPEVDQLVLENGELPTIEIYNNPLGTPGENVVKKLKDIKKRTELWGGDTLLKLEKLLETLRNICRAIQTLQDVYNAVEALKSPMYGAAQLLETWTGTGRIVWNTYLQIECSTRVAKEMLWPNDADFQFVGAGEKGALSSFVGGTRTKGEPITIGDYNVGGYVRKACAFVQCSQCSRGFGFADELANWNGVLPDVGEKGAGALTTGLIDVTTFGQNLPGQVQAVDYSDYYKGSPKDSTALGRKPEGSTEETYRRAAAEGLTTPQPPTGTSGIANVQQQDLSLMKGVNFEANIDPFNNWFVALGCFCLPGIIHNMAKYQELQCIQAKCIADHARLGLSTAECDEANRYRECLFFKGNWFTTILWTIGVSWFQTMAERVITVIKELPERLFVAFRDNACNEWDNAVKSGATIDTAGANQFATAKSVSQCFSISVSEAALDNQVGVAKSVTCGLLDAGMLTLSWKEFQQRAFNPDNYDSEKIRSEADKYCKDAFSLIEDKKGSGTATGVTSSIPVGARPVAETS